jgi:hypothetical protein
MDIEEVHRILDDLDEVIRELSAEKREEVDTYEVVDLCRILGDVMGYGTAYGDMATELRISPSVLNKFVKIEGRVKVQAARILAERLRTYVRSHDQRTLRAKPEEPASPPKTPLPQTASQSLTFPAERWASIGASSDVKLKTAAVAALLDSIVEQTKRTNLPPDQQILTEIERNQLISVLETALAMLKSPMAEKGMLRKARDVLQKAAGSAVEKGVQKGTGKLAEAAANKLADLLQSLF